MPLQATSGAASYDAFGGGVAAVPKYIEEYFSTFLYQGTGAAQTITNGIDLAGEGGLVWVKRRNLSANHGLIDTVRGRSSVLFSDDTAAAQTSSAGTDLTSFNGDGFSIGTNNNLNINNSGSTFASWTFRKQPKFFDVVTFSGDVPYPGAGVSHNLGSVPGCIICKRTDSTSAWGVWHRANSVSASVTGLSLNTTGAALYTNQNFSSAMTSTSFAPALVNDASGNAMNTAGATYVAYLFAHDAGGFGLTGTDNVISCGSFTTDGSGNATVNLGYEAQWILAKRSISPGGNWLVLDTMRGLNQTSTANLFPNTSGAETTSTPGSFKPTATGFSVTADAQVGGSDTWIYVAIRRGPMKVPTSGTSVFNTVFSASSGDPAFITSFPVDFATWKYRSSANSWNNSQRLTAGFYQEFNTTAAEAAYSPFEFDFQNGWSTAGQGFGTDLFSYCFRRAPGFMDVVCYTGTGSARTVTHNLAAVPEMMLIKRRDTTAQWQFYFAGLGNTKSVQLPDNDKVTSSGLFNNTSPTSSVFTVGVNSPVNASGGTYVAYLAATCAGVSKVGTYTGTGTTQQIDCGFAAGARFVLIKNVGVNDYAYGYYVWDTARGIVSGNDPYLLLNSTAAEVTNTDYIDTYSAGFEISSTAPAGINANGDQFVYWAIA